MSPRHSLILLLLFLLSLPAVTSRIYASDETEYFAFLRSLWFDRDLSFENEYQHFYQNGVAASANYHETFLERATRTGLRENFGTIGCALLWAPFYVATDITLRILRAAGRPVTVDGFSQPYIAAACYASACYGWLALLLSAKIARRVLPNASDTSVTVATLATWIGTPLLFYMYVTPPMPHATSAFTVSAFVLAWLHVRRSWSRRGLAGLAALAALMTMVREQDAFFIAGPAIDFLWPRANSSEPAGAGVPSRPPRVVLVDLAVAAMVFALVFLPQAIAYLVLNGRIGPSPLVSRKMTWTAPHAFQVLASPEHGLLFWTPLAALALAGLLVAAWRGSSQSKRLALCLIAMVALQVYIAGSVESWTVAGAFGQRRFVSLTVVVVVGLTALLTAWRPRPGRVIALTAMALAAWWNVAMMIQFSSGLMDRQRLELARNAYTAFVVVPWRLPEIVYRYALRRESFYAPAGRQPTP